jgi:hypothetical protein
LLVSEKQCSGRTHSSANDPSRITRPHMSRVDLSGFTWLTCPLIHTYQLPCPIIWVQHEGGPETNGSNWTRPISSIRDLYRSCAREQQENGMPIHCMATIPSNAWSAAPRGRALKRKPGYSLLRLIAISATKPFGPNVWLLLSAGNAHHNYLRRLCTGRHR